MKKGRVGGEYRVRRNNSYTKLRGLRKHITGWEGACKAKEELKEHVDV